MNISNFTNISVVSNLHYKYKRATEALAAINKALQKFKDGALKSVEGNEPSIKKNIYGLYVSEYRDHSYSDEGFPNLDLTGLKLHESVLNHLKKELEIKIAEMEKEIAAL